MIARALAKEPEDRYPSAGDLGRAARAAARGEPVTETERSVAVGPAAPEPPTNGHAGRAPRSRPVAAPPPPRRRDERPRVTPPTRPAQSPLIPPPPGEGRRAPRPPPRARAARRASRPPRRLRARARARRRPGAGNATAPLSENDVRDVARTSREAYEAEDGAALRRTLTPGVERVLPSGVARGRKNVVNEYERQFRAQDTSGYELDDLEVERRPRRARERQLPRRARGRDAIEGRIVFGVVRDHGQPRIALIAVTPRAEPLSRRGRRRRGRSLPRRTWLPADGSCSHTPRPLGTSGSRKPPPRSDSSAEAAALGHALGVVDAAPTRSGTATRCSRVTRKAVSAAERLRAVAATSMTFGPGSSGTSELKRPPLDLRAPALDLHPRRGRAHAAADPHVLPRTSAVSPGLETLELHGRLRPPPWGSSSPQPARRRTERR